MRPDNLTLLWGEACGMGKTQRQLRLVQSACLLVVVACIVLAYWKAHEIGATSGSVGTGPAIIILLALWSASSGFIWQRRLQRRGQAISSKPTPFTRWRAGHIFRLWSATSVGIWAVLLYDFHGPLWIANVLFGVAILLLLIWRPNAAPTLDDAPPGQ
jgi:hypothetical protein